MLADKKIAIVYDRVNTSFGGAEKVLLALQKIYPQADLFTSVYDAKKLSGQKLLKSPLVFYKKFLWPKAFIAILRH